MLVFIAVMLALIPAIAIVYPFLRRGESNEWLDDERSPMEILQQRWEAAFDGILSAELEYAISNLSEEDYRWLRRQYMREAALVMRAMELEQEEEEAMLKRIETESKRARERVQGNETVVGADTDTDN